MMLRLRKSIRLRRCLGCDCILYIKVKKSGNRGVWILVSFRRKLAHRQTQAIGLCVDTICQDQ